MWVGVGSAVEGMSKKGRGEGKGGGGRRRGSWRLWGGGAW